MSPGAPNIVVAMAAQHRADLMGCVGACGVITPNLDRLAAEGARFSRVACQGPLCMPARASFMTERYVRDHGVYTNWAEVASDSPTYVWALHEAGYHTALLGRAHLYREARAAAHVDELAGRLTALGFVEVHVNSWFAARVPSSHPSKAAADGVCAEPGETLLR